MVVRARKGGLLQKAAAAVGDERVVDSTSSGDIPTTTKGRFLAAVVRQRRRRRGNDNNTKAVGIRSIDVAVAGKNKDDAEEDGSLISELTSPISPSSWNQSPTTSMLGGVAPPQDEDDRPRTPTTDATAPHVTPEKKSGSLVSSMLLSMVDMSCVTTATEHSGDAPAAVVDSSLTFPPPEWGVPPEGEEEDDDTITTPASVVRGSPQRKHETFEMVYQEPMLIPQQQRGGGGGMRKKALGLFRPSKTTATPLGITPRSDVPEPSLLRDTTAAAPEPPRNPAARVLQRVFSQRSAAVTGGSSSAGSGSIGPSSETTMTSEDESAGIVSQYTTTTGSVFTNDTTPTNESTALPMHRKVLESIKGAAGHLETVAEEESSEYSSVASFKVRVPGEPNKFITDKDLIGDEVVEELYNTIDDVDERPNIVVPTDPPPSARASSPVLLTPSRSPARSPERYQPFESDDEEEEDNVVVVPPRTKPTKAASSSSWKDRWGLKREKSASTAAAAASSNAATHKNKPMWKAALDPSTGKTYYYHRKTRETTWAKPPDALILTPPAKKKKNKASKKKAETAEVPAKKKKAAATTATKSPKREMTRVVTPRNGDILMPHARSKERKDPPPDASDLEIDRMLSDVSPEAATLQNQGEQLLEKLRNVVDDQPFDEPLLETSSNSKKPVVLDEKSVANRTQAAATIYSGFSSHKSRLSESTQPIRNTSRGVIQSMMAVPKKRPVGSAQQPRPQIPKNIPVPRLRELNVEEFSTSRRDLHLTDRSRVLGPRNPAAAMRARKDNSAAVQSSAHPAGGAGPGRRPSYRKQHHAHEDARHHSMDDDIDGDEEYDDKDSYAGTDSISALSEDNLSYVERRDLSYDDARRRALQRAIAQQDWDLAAQMADSLRRKPSRPAHLPPLKGEAQSEIDHYISRNDWTSVENYIQNARVVAHHTERRRMNQHLMKPRPQKRFGARSQLQHARDLGGSTDSFDSFGTGHSDYTPETPPGKQEHQSTKGKHLQAPRAQARRPREFAC